MNNTKYYKTKGEDLDLVTYENDGNFQIEEFWIALFKNKNTSYKELSRFMINLTLIPHSNTFVEKMFSHVNANKEFIGCCDCVFFNQSKVLLFR